MASITITYGNIAENHPGMEKIGEELKNGLSYDDLVRIKKCYFEDAKSEIVHLSDCIGGDVEIGMNIEAYVLVVKGGVDYLLSKGATDKMYDEQIAQSPDKQAKMRGRVVNKHARWNLCYSDYDQCANFEEGQGTVVHFNKVPFTKKLRNIFSKAVNSTLQAESNVYYDQKKCGIGFHGDAERSITIGVRLGPCIPMHFQWFHRFKPIGDRCKLDLNHGDIYFMCEKATGRDWKMSSKLTLRHAAGCAKYTTIKSP